MMKTSEQNSPADNYAHLRQQLALRHWLTLIVGICCALLYVYYDYTAVRAKSEESLASIARLVDEHLSKTISETNLVLKQVARRVGRDGEPLFARQAFLRGLLAEEVPELQHLRSISLINLRGELVAASHQELKSPTLVNDRDYVRAWLDGTQTSRLFVGVPVKARVSSQKEGEWVLTFSTPILGAGGELVGVALATIDPFYFSRVYGAIKIEQKAQISVIREDGILLARNPHVEERMGKSLASGQVFNLGLAKADEGLLRYRSMVDNTERISAFRWVKGWPLALVVGAEPEDIYASWQRRVALVVLFVALFAGVLTRLYFRQLRQLREAASANDALAQEKQFSDDIIKSLPGVFYILDEQGCFVRWDTLFETISGYSAGEMLGRSALDIIAEEDREAVAERIRNAFESGVAAVDARLLNRAGQSTPYHFTGRRCQLNGRLYLIGLGEDCTEQRQAESALRLYASVFEQSGEAILISDRENHILAVNAAFTAITGYELEDVRGANPRMFSSGHTPRSTYQALWAALAEEGFWQGEIWDRRKDGSIYPKWMSVSVVRDPAGQLTHYIAGFTDITERKAVEAQISHLAHHDSLTGLLNRFSLQSQLDQALSTAKREGGELAVMFIDLDRFKTINDTLGHAVGDALLVEVARRLRADVRESDIVARLGGDEFVVVLTAVEGVTGSARVAEKMVDALRAPYLVANNELRTTPSLGVALFPSDGGDGETLMKNADTAMYHAKSQGRNNIQFFTEKINQVAMERLRLERDLRRGLNEKQFELHYQPKLDGRSGRVIGVEALVRWRHPDSGLVPPNQFIPVAEETGLILALGDWVLDEACRQLALWREQGLKTLTVAVNLSALQLRSPTLIDYVEATLKSHGLQGSDLELEITESVVMDDPDASISKLMALRDLGVRLSIDDFGTGYSSLSYLKLLPIHALKLDRSFVMDIETDANDVTICTATITLAHNLGLTVVAEGVESEAQRLLLAAHQCDIFQGYLFSRPLPAAELPAFVRQRLFG